MSKPPVAPTPTVQPRGLRSRLFGGRRWSRIAVGTLGVVTFFAWISFSHIAYSLFTDLSSLGDVSTGQATAYATTNALRLAGGFGMAMASTILLLTVAYFSTNSRRPK